MSYGFKPGFAVAFGKIPVAADYILTEEGILDNAISITNAQVGSYYIAVVGAAYDFGDEFITEEAACQDTITTLESLDEVQFDLSADFYTATDNPIIVTCGGRNGGDCDPDQPGYCYCIPPFIGDQCQLTCPSAGDNICSGCGFCYATNSTNSQAKCACHDGYTGSTCEQTVQEPSHTAVIVVSVFFALAMSAIVFLGCWINKLKRNAARDIGSLHAQLLEPTTNA
jgi:hypothetical protein